MLIPFREIVSNVLCELQGNTQHGRRILQLLPTIGKHENLIALTIDTIYSYFSEEMSREEFDIALAYLIETGQVKSFVIDISRFGFRSRFIYLS